MATRSSQGGQVQPLLTAPNDVSWQDKKGLYEVSTSVYTVFFCQLVPYAHFLCHVGSTLFCTV